MRLRKRNEKYFYNLLMSLTPREMMEFAKAVTRYFGEIGMLTESKFFNPLDKDKKERKEIQ